MDFQLNLCEKCTRLKKTAQCFIEFCYTVSLQPSKLMLQESTFLYCTKKSSSVQFLLLNKKDEPTKLSIICWFLLVFCHKRKLNTNGILD